MFVTCISNNGENCRVENHRAISNGRWDCIRILSWSDALTEQVDMYWWLKYKQCVVYGMDWFLIGGTLLSIKLISII